MDTHTLGFLENDFNVSDLLQVRKGKDDNETFRNMSGSCCQLKGRHRALLSCLPSPSVAHLLRETKNNIKGSEDSEIIN